MVSQWRARCVNAATPWANTNESCWNETRSWQDDAFWYIRSYEWSCWVLEQNKNEFLFWPPRPRIFRNARRYLLHYLIFPHSLSIFKDFGTQITNTAVFTKIFIFQKWVFFSILGRKLFIFQHRPQSSISLETLRRPVWIFLFRINHTSWHICMAKWPISHCAANI